jgi:small GTP-binding protein
MEQKKICMVGAFAVGKTSLVQRFCKGIFSDKYLTTVGVKIDKAVAQTGSGPVSLILWDLAGEDTFHTVQTSYLTGAHGLVYVVDLTRRGTLDVATVLRKKIEETMGRVPSVLLANKNDLAPEYGPSELASDDGPPFHLTSALTGDHVQSSFEFLADAMLASPTARLQRPTG